MTEHTTRLDDVRLIEALGRLRGDLAWPSAAERTPDLAARVRATLEAEPVPARRAWAGGWRLGRGALVLALLAVLALAAVAGAVGLGLPGLRLSLGPASPPPASPSAPRPSASVGDLPGADLDLGTAVSLEAARAATGRPLPTFDDDALGPPDAVYLDRLRAGQVAQVWAAGPDLPVTRETGVGLILMAFDGMVEGAFFQKIVGSGSTLERVTVGTAEGFWISGDPHVFFYETDGEFVGDERRWVGDALLWSDGTTTYRIEAALGRDATIALAERLPAAPAAP